MSRNATLSAPQNTHHLVLLPVTTLVLKMKLGFVFVSYGKPTGMEMIVMKEVYTHSSLEIKGKPGFTTPDHTGPGKHPGQPGDRRRDGRAWPRAYIGVLQERMGEAK